VRAECDGQKCLHQDALSGCKQQLVCIKLVASSVFVDTALEDDYAGIGGQRSIPTQLFSMAPQKIAASRAHLASDWP
jgi:hypothetical protein